MGLCLRSRNATVPHTRTYRRTALVRKMKGATTRLDVSTSLVSYIALALIEASPNAFRLLAGLITVRCVRQIAGHKNPRFDHVSRSFGHAPKTSCFDDTSQQIRL
jgi:hypothetical protein